MFFILFAITLVVSNVYLNWNTNKPSGLISLPDYFQNVRQKAKFWELLQIVTVPFIYVYNQAIGIFWLIQGLFRIIVWIFQNIIVDGIWLIARLLFHYFIFWPWKILRLAFEQIKYSWKLSFYKIGVTGLFIALLLIFLGRYLVQQYKYPLITSHALTLLSIFPVAWALAKISSLRFTSTGSTTSSNSKISFYLIIFIGLALSLFGIETLILFIGTFSSLAPAIGSLLSGGSVFISMLLIFNCIVVFYLLSIFPQLLLHTSGNFKSILKSCFSHLLHKWPQYILGAFAALLPATLLSILPTILISGSVYITQNITDGIYKYRIEQKSIAITNSAPVGQLADWIDSKKVSQDSARILIQIYGKQKELEQEKANLQINRNFFTSQLKKYSNPLGATPLFGVAGEAYLYFVAGQKAVNIQPALTPIETDNYIQNLDLSKEQTVTAIKTLSADIKSELEKSKSRKDKLENELENVCVIKQPYSSGGIQSAGNPPISSVVASYDACEEKRKAIRTQISEQEENIQYVEQKLSRLTQLKGEIEIIQMHLSENVSNMNFIFSFSYLILGIWICLIVAFCCGFLVIVFANLNYAIYHDEEDIKNWKIMVLFREANTRNRNQPLLGLLITATLSILFVIYGGLYSNFKGLHLINKLKNVFSISITQRNPPLLSANLIKNPIFSAPSENSEIPGTKAEVDATVDSIAASQAAVAAVTQAEAQDAQSVQAYQLPDANLATGESTESQTADGLNSYIAFVELFSTEDKAQQARSSYAAKGINLRIIPPGTFLGNNDQFYLLCAGFEVSLLEAQRLKNKLNEQGINCVIQKF